MGCENLRMHVLSSCCGAASQFFSKMMTYKRASSGVKIIIVRAAPDRNYNIFCFPIGPKANGDSVVRAFKGSDRF